MSTTTTLTEIETIISEIQAALPTIEAIAQATVLLLPDASTISPLLPVVEGYLNSAFAIFKTVSSTMDANTAQPLIVQIVADLNAAMDAISAALATVAPSADVAVWKTMLAEAEAVVTAVGALATTAVAAAGTTPPVKPATPLMRVRGH